MKLAEYLDKEQWMTHISDCSYRSSSDQIFTSSVLIVNRNKTLTTFNYKCSFYMQSLDYVEFNIFNPDCIERPILYF